MKIRYLSDLHMEFTPYKLSFHGEDVLVLAGDLSSSATETLELIIAYLTENTTTHVVFVAGNHDYYNSSIPKIDSFWAEVETDLKKEGNDRFHFLQDRHVRIHGVIFHGATLWTDMIGADRAVIERSINDYRCIDRFNMLLCRVLHQRSRKLIEQTLDREDEPVVVVTHHLPSFKSILSKYAGSPLNAAFASHMDSIVIKAAIWIHGHTHTNVDYVLGNTRVLCNPRGYITQGHIENPDFSEEAFVTVGDTIVGDAI